MRGQYQGYREEPHVAPDSDVETFCALRVHIDFWRWTAVPWYLRSGKYLPLTACEVVVRLKPPPQNLFGDAAMADTANILRFHLSPHSTIALSARVRRMGKEFVGDMREFTQLDEEPGEQSPYERLLTDAINTRALAATSLSSEALALTAVHPSYHADDKLCQAETTLSLPKPLASYKARSARLNVSLKERSSGTIVVTPILAVTAIPPTEN